MNNARYQRYRDQIFKLAKTMVVKSELIAEAMNRHLSELEYTIKDDRRTWRYYCNLAGEYHESEETMYVRSTDTLEEIAFTKENLDRHRDTYENYRYGTRYYQALVDAYPEQELLILGILNPIDKDRAIEADEGEILYYDSDLVESQEYSLISHIQSWIDSFLLRWSVDDYALIDELYPAAKFGVLFSHLPLEIFNAREQRAGTIEAHSYHIREHLASHLHLDRYLDGLSTYQILYLYRNIRYLLRNPGHQSSFEDLLENLFTRSNLPLARYELRHNYQHLLDNDSLRPDVDALREPLNDASSDNRDDQRPIDDLLGMEQNISLRNYEYIRDNRDEIVNSLRNSYFSRLPSKVLECSIIDTSDSLPVLFEDTLINHWLYLAHRGVYQANIEVINPANNEVLSLDPLEAFYVYLYVFNYSQDIEIETIPTLYVHDVRKPRRPDRDELRSVVDEEYIDSEDIEWLYHSIPPELEQRIISTDAFNQYAREINIAQNRQRNLYQGQEDPHARAMLEAAASRLYQQVSIEPPDNDDYRDYLSQLNIDIEELGSEEASSMANDIFNEVTGVRFPNESSLLIRQRNVIDIMRMLSSYSVQYIRRINDDVLRQMEQVVPRIQPESWQSRSTYYYDLVGIEPHNPGFSGHQLYSRPQTHSVDFHHIDFTRPSHRVDHLIGIEHVYLDGAKTSFSEPTPKEHEIIENLGVSSHGGKRPISVTTRIDFSIGGVTFDVFEPYIPGEAEEIDGYR